MNASSFLSHSNVLGHADDNEQKYLLMKPDEGRLLLSYVSTVYHCQRLIHLCYTFPHTFVSLYKMRPVYWTGQVESITKGTDYTQVTEANQISKPVTLDMSAVATDKNQTKEADENQISVNSTKGTTTQDEVSYDNSTFIRSRKSQEVLNQIAYLYSGSRWYGTLQTKFDIDDPEYHAFWDELYENNVVYIR